ncbi:MAG TPA: toll/interleukin-1 receptor domain-containing protein [Rhizomicrobium sp.]|jgi:hypothetical protein|nr:toll/interleukin-1 receptor domain-containing protein [Rhizomicrobium sp.]
MRLYAFDVIKGGKYLRGFMPGENGVLLDREADVPSLGMVIKPSDWRRVGVIIARPKEGRYVQKIIQTVKKKGFVVTEMGDPPERFFAFDIELDVGFFRLFSTTRDISSFHESLLRRQLAKDGDVWTVRRETYIGEVGIISQEQATTLGVDDFPALIRIGFYLVLHDAASKVELLERRTLRAVQKEMEGSGVSIRSIKIDNIRLIDDGVATPEPALVGLADKSADRYHDLFLSHTSADKPFVRRLREDLLKQGVGKVWVDEAEIGIGDSLLGKIDEGLRATRYVGVVLSPRSISAPWVKKELEMAMSREIADRQVVVLPLMYEKCELPLFLAGKLYADFTDESFYSVTLRKLLDRLKA